MATNNAHNIMLESDDIFASSAHTTKEETMRSEEPSLEQVAKKSDGSELTTVAALTGLAISPPSSEVASESKPKKGKKFTIPQRFTKSGRKRAVPFTLKLMNVLSRQEYSQIIAWTPSGLSFNIINPKALTADILPSHFKNAQYSSFTRKLHRWGFIRHYRGEEAGAFFHKHFQKNRLDLAEKMTCYKEPEKTRVTPKEKKAEVIVFPKPSELAPRKATGCTPSQFLSSLPADWPAASQLSSMSSHTSSGVDWNAAIELEVARRLKERVSAAAQSRQALVVMQRQLPTTAAMYPDQRLLTLQQSGLSSGLAGNNNSSNMFAALKQAAYKQQVNANYVALWRGRSNQTAYPATNIRIAKSA